MNDLRERLETLAADGVPRGPGVVWRDAHGRIDSDSDLPRSPRRRTVRTMVMVAALVVALVVATIVVVDHDSRTPQVGSTPSERSLRGLYDTSNETPVADPLFMVPTKLPDGYRLGRAYGGNRPGSSGGGGGSFGLGAQQFWSRFDAARTRPTATVWVQWGGPLSTRNLDHWPSDMRERFQQQADASVARKLESVRRDSKDTVRGRPALAVGNSLVWEEPAGNYVQISSESASPEELHVFAEGLRRRKSGGFKATTVPEGYRYLGEAPGFASEGENWRAISASDTNGDFVEVEVRDAPDNVPGTLLWQGKNQDDDPHIVTVDGRLGVATTEGIRPHTGQNSAPQGRTRTNVVRWLEPGNVIVEVSASNLSEDELLRVARDLARVDQPKWAKLKSPSRQLR